MQYAVIYWEPAVFDSAVFLADDAVQRVHRTERNPSPDPDMPSSSSRISCRCRPGWLRRRPRRLVPPASGPRWRSVE